MTKRLSGLAYHPSESLATRLGTWPIESRSDADVVALADLGSPAAWDELERRTAPAKRECCNRGAPFCAGCPELCID